MSVPVPVAVKSHRSGRVQMLANTYPAEAPLKNQLWNISATCFIAHNAGTSLLLLFQVQLVNVDLTAPTKSTSDMWLLQSLVLHCSYKHLASGNVVALLYHWVLLLLGRCSSLFKIALPLPPFAGVWDTLSPQTHTVTSLEDFLQKYVDNNVMIPARRRNNLGCAW